MHDPVLQQALAEEVASWPAGPGGSGVVVLSPAGSVAGAGSRTTAYAWASVTKLLTALAVLRAAHHGRVDLEEPAGPPGSTLRHLLGHASGLGFEGDRVLAAPGARRVYSNAGPEAAAAHLAARLGRPFPALLDELVLDPLGLVATRLDGSPAHGATGPVDDLARLAHALLVPRVLEPAVVALLRTEPFPGLPGLLPGFGRQEPNTWGHGAEVRGTKAPHWTAPNASPATFGHFGQAGSFLWVDPDARLACVAGGTEPFGSWAAEAWPRLSGLVMDHLRPRGATPVPEKSAS